MSVELEMESLSDEVEIDDSQLDEIFRPLMVDIGAEYGLQLYSITYSEAYNLFYYLLIRYMYSYLNFKAYQENKNNF